MKVEYISDPKLLTKIKRSLSFVRDRLLREGKTETPTFIFEYVECSKVEFEVIRIREWNFCLKVTEKSTKKQFIVTQIMSFRDDVWTLFKVINEE